MRHALSLGRDDVDELLAEMGSLRWVEWLAFYRLEARELDPNAKPLREAPQRAPAASETRVVGDVTISGDAEEQALIARLMKQ